MFGKKSLVLASESPRKKELLASLGYEFEIIPSRFNEDSVKEKEPKKFALKCALGKALDVASRLKEGIVLAADCIVALDGKIFGKAENKQEAKRMLETFSGRTHSVFTGLVLLDVKTKKKKTAIVESKVAFKNLSPKDIGAYLALGEWKGKAGAYAFQLHGKKMLVESYSGSESNIIGLPLEKLGEMLGEFLSEKLVL